jgi:mannitol-1-phosphate/altronate dehydrogenase
MDSEVIPLIESPEHLQAEAFFKSVYQRFSNKKVMDPLERLSCQGLRRVPAFLSPSTTAILEANQNFRAKDRKYGITGRSFLIEFNEFKNKNNNF